MMRTIKLFGLVTLLLSGCASYSEDIPSAYVSPIQYQSYDCDQINSEIQRVKEREGYLKGSIDETAKDDSIKMGVGIAVFPPLLFFLEGDGPESSEYARLTGEHQALLAAGAEKNCQMASN